MTDVESMTCVLWLCCSPQDSRAFTKAREELSHKLSPPQSGDRVPVPGAPPTVNASPGASSATIAKAHFLPAGVLCRHVWHKEDFVRVVLSFDITCVCHFPSLSSLPRTDNAQSQVSFQEASKPGHEGGHRLHHLVNPSPRKGGGTFRS